MSLAEGYALVTETPAAEDYLRLRVVAGLSSKTEKGAAIGLPNTYCSAQIKYDGHVVGMGRVIGDGALFFQVVDIAVEPAHQGKGLGKAIMGSLMEQLRARAPSGAYVSLLADGEAHRLYAQYGFQLTAPASAGMAMKLP